jgi:hypothetical protein
MPTQVAALTYQSQLTHSTATNTGQRQEMQLTQMATNQEAHHATMHQLIDGLTAVAFIISNAGHGIGCFGGRGYVGHGQKATVACRAAGAVLPHTLVDSPKAVIPPPWHAPSAYPRSSWQLPR